jgi:hypothetical protein
MTNIKLLTLTWGHTEDFDISKTSLYQSFKKYNPEKEIIHHHFNRSLYWELERQYQETYGVESEYLLYKITFLLEKAKQIDSDYVIFCDANDVACFTDIDDLPNQFDLENFIIVGHEKNMWPPLDRKLTWPDYVDYDKNHMTNRTFLNSGMILAKTQKYVELLQSLVDNVLSTKIPTFNNDQGVFTYYYNKGFHPIIKLDFDSLFVVNTYSRNTNEYRLEDERLISNSTGIKPYFLHDNGWNHGSPRYHNHFNLVDIYTSTK